jgi:hypothetical protein
MEKENMHICSKCNKEFKTQRYYDSHIRNCNGNTCEHCKEVFYNITSLQKHLKTCLQKYINEIENLNTELTTKNELITKLELDLIEERKKYTNYYTKYENTSDSYEILQQKYNESQQLISNLKDDIIIKDKELSELKAINKINNERIEDLKSSNKTIIYNQTDNRIMNNQFSKNINNTILIKSPEAILETLDIKNILQTHRIQDEEEFAEIFDRKGLTKNIEVTDRSRYKVKYINKQSEVIEDQKCNMLANQIYSLSRESAERVIKDSKESEMEIDKNKSVYGKSITTKDKEILKNQTELAEKILRKNDKSLDKFGKCLVNYSGYNFKKIMDQHKDKTIFIKKLLSILKHKNNIILFDNFIHIGEQLHHYIKKDITYSESEKYILVKDDSDVNVKIDGDFLLTFILELLKDKTKAEFIDDQIKTLLEKKYSIYQDIHNITNFLYGEPNVEELSKAKYDIIYGLTTS